MYTMNSLSSLQQNLKLGTKIYNNCINILDTKKKKLPFTKSTLVASYY